MSKFVDFLTDLTSDPSKLKALVQDPENIMNAAGLTDEEKRVMYTKDKKALSEYLRTKEGDDTVVSRVHNDWWPL